MVRGRAKTQPRVFIDDDMIHFQSPYNEGSLAAMRGIFGRRWNNFTKTNTFPINAEAAELVLQMVADFHPDASVEPEVKALAKQSNGNGKRVQVTEVEGGIEIKTPYSVEFIESLKNNFHPSLRAWRKENKTWFIDHYAVDRALKLIDEFWPNDANIQGKLQERKDDIDKASEYAVATTVPDDQIIELGGKKLYGFQCAGVYFLELRGSGLIADEMGLGKTVQALAYLARNEDRYPTLIVCPSSVKMNWAREIMRWIGSDEVSCDVIDGGYSYEIKPNGKRGKIIDRIECLKESSFADIVIVNYDMLKKHKTKLREMNCSTVIFDESHYLKNSTTNLDNITNDMGEFKINPKTNKPYQYNGSGRAEAAAKIARNIQYRVLLTGTPIMNRPSEAWHQLHLVAPEAWPNFWRFAKQYANLTKGRWGWNYDGASNLSELHNLIIGTYMVRRRKMEVLKDMPEKVVYNTILDIDSKGRKEYDKAHKNFLKWAFETGGNEKVQRVRRAESLTRMTTLKRLAAEAKVETVIEHATDFLDSREDDQLVIFAHHSTVLNALITGIKKTGTTTVSILGSDSITKRQKAVDDFREGRARVIVCSILAAGTGVDGLQVAQNMFFVERTWRPADHLQAEDRIHRIGQDDMCFIEYLDLDNSIDEAMANMIESKKKIAMQVIDGKEVNDNFVDKVMDEVLKLDQ